MERQTIWDPLRKKQVALTPEERVRQWFIGILSKDCAVPVHMMMSEVSIKLGSKPWRADILVWDREQKPLAVIECKRPETALDRTVLEQAVRYNMALGVRCIVITNGTATFVATRGGDGGFNFSGRMPVYEEMLKLCQQ